MRQPAFSTCNKKKKTFLNEKKKKIGKSFKETNFCLKPKKNPRKSGQFKIRRTKEKKPKKKNGNVDGENCKWHAIENLNN